MSANEEKMIISAADDETTNFQTNNETCRESAGGDEGGSPSVKRPKLKDEYNQKGMLLDEANNFNMPIQLGQIIANMIRDETTKDFYLLMLVYIVAVEMGFCTYEEYLKLKGKLKHSKIHNMHFHAENVHMITALPVTCQCSTQDRLRLPFYCYYMNLTFLWAINRNQDSMQTPEENLLTKLTAVFDGEHLIVTLTPPAAFKDRGFSSLLKIDDYLQKDKVNHVCLSNLDTLSYKLRTELFLPLEALYFYWFDIATPAAGLALNPTLFIYVFKYIDQSDLGNLSQVSADFRDAVNYFRKRSRHMHPLSTK